MLTYPTLKTRVSESSAHARTRERRYTSRDSSGRRYCYETSNRSHNCVSLYALYVPCSLSCHRSLLPVFSGPKCTYSTLASPSINRLPALARCKPYRIFVYLYALSHLYTAISTSNFVFLALPFHILFHLFSVGTLHCGVWPCFSPPLPKGYISRS